MKVLGKNVINYFYDNGLWKIAVCARSCELVTTTDFIETSVKGSGKFRTYLPSINGFTGSMEGIVTLDEPNTLSLADLRALQLSHTRFLSRFQRTDEDGNVYTDEMYFYIASISDSGSHSDVAGFSITLQGDGAITQIFTPTPQTAGIVTRVDFTAVDGQTSVTNAALIGKELIELILDGISMGPLLLAGTPVNKEFHFDPAAGTITWGIPAAAGQENYYVYQ